MLVKVSGNERNEKPSRASANGSELASFDHVMASKAIHIVQAAFGGPAQVPFQKEGFIGLAIAGSRKQLSIRLDADQDGEPGMDRGAEALMVTLLYVPLYLAAHRIAFVVDMKAGRGIEPSTNRDD